VTTVISVVICTHNPLPHFLEKVLQALQAQTVPHDQWELILVDNLSAPALATRFDLSWHPQGRIVVEEKLGLTYARWAGFAASRGDVILYVDDDNILAPDYIEQTLRIAADYPFLGAWGGQILIEFEAPPSPEEQPFTRWQLHHEVSEIRWANYAEGYANIPSGAGLVVRRQVLDLYMEKLARDPLRQKLGRSGAHGGCREDTDIVLTSFELGLGMGEFPSLILRHLTPRRRLTRDYCLKQAYSLGHSTVILDRVLRRPTPDGRLPLLTRARELYQYWKMSPFERRTHRETLKGHREALEMLRQFDADNGSSAAPASS
jgi:glycosyltransferase involved in cell wall biosynthesis